MIRKLLIASLMVAGIAHAASPEVKLYRDGENVDPQEVARILGGAAEPAAAAAQAPIRYRSIRMLDAPAPVATAAAPAATASFANPGPDAAAGAAAVRPAALALPVQFAFDSAELLPRARTQLEALAQGIRMLRPDQQVTIEGHTDARGTEEYNLELSRRRAQAVRDFLVSVEGIDAARLKAVGVGKDRPYDAEDPFAAENRRVQFRGS